MWPPGWWYMRTDRQGCCVFFRRDLLGRKLAQWGLLVWLSTLDALGGDLHSGFCPCRSGAPVIVAAPCAVPHRSGHPTRTTTYTDTQPTGDAAFRSHTGVTCLCGATLVAHNRREVVVLCCFTNVAYSYVSSRAGGADSVWCTLDASRMACMHGLLPMQV